MDDPSAAYKKVNVKRERRFGLLEKRGLAGYLFILPFIIGFFAILLPAVATSFWYMFHDARITFGGVETEWVGLANLRAAFLEDAVFVPLFMEFGVGVFGDIIIIICFSFFISNVLNQKFIGRGLSRMIFFLPVLLTAGIVAQMAENTAALESGSFEAISMFDQLGFGAIFGTAMLMDTMGIPDTALPIIGLNIYNFIFFAIYSIESIVNESGVQILIFLSALQSISPSLFEAAKVEGATKWEEFWKITFPMLTPMILVAIVYTIIATFTNPRYGALEMIHEASFGAGTLGYGAALAWIYFSLILLILGLVWLVIARRVSYLD